MIAALCPHAKVICCVRSPAWILDSIERLIQGNPFARSKMFPAEAGENVYMRAEYTLKKGVLAAPLQSLRQAWYGDEAHRLIAIRYDSLVAQPSAVIARLYELLDQPPFAHNFENLDSTSPSSTHRSACRDCTAYGAG